jgi:hypothetical protein
VKSNARGGEARGAAVGYKSTRFRIAARSPFDPQIIAKARELRDRYLEHVNSEAHALRAIGKYEVSRLPDPTRDAHIRIQPPRTPSTPRERERASCVLLGDLGVLGG